jgi:microcystin-dependent protein
MSQPYYGEIRMFAGNFAPLGWMFCAGQILPIAGNDTLFQVIGTTYGGDGVQTFALPNLQSRVPIHQGSGFTLAQIGGAETVTLNANQLPTHTHALLATSSPANDGNPGNNLLAQASTFDGYEAALPPSASMATASVGSNGGSQPHENLQPYLCLNFIIAITGIFPSPT